jgi:DNA mismatch repair protein MSH2
MIGFSYYMTHFFSLSEKIPIQLIQARHPCVEAQESVTYIPNDIRLVYGASNFLIVTGPNCVSQFSFSTLTYK